MLFFKVYKDVYRVGPVAYIDCHKGGGGPIVDITTELFCILFTISIVNTELEHYPITISDTLLY